MKTISIIIFFILLPLINFSQTNNMQVKISKQKAVFLAEQYISNNGYTNTKITYSKLKDEKYNQLKKTAIGIQEEYILPNIGKPQIQYTIGFEYTDSEKQKLNIHKSKGIGVLITCEGLYYEISILEEPISFEHLSSVPTVAYDDSFLTKRNYYNLVNLITEKGNHFKNGYYFYQIADISIMLHSPCTGVSQVGADACTDDITIHLKPATDGKSWYEDSDNHIMLSLKPKNEINSEIELRSENVSFNDITAKWIKVKRTKEKSDKYILMAKYWMEIIINQRNSIIIDVQPMEKSHVKLVSISPEDTEQALLAIYEYIKNNHLKDEAIQNIYFNWDKFNIQFFGVQENSRAYIYANFYPQNESLDFRVNEIQVDDGGFWYWQIEYNLTNGKILNFYHNGEG